MQIHVISARHEFVQVLSQVDRAEQIRVITI